jgi:hypothetical protein
LRDDLKILLGCQETREALAEQQVIVQQNEAYGRPAAC